MFRHNANPKFFWKPNSHLHWSNPLRRWVYVKFTALFVTGLISTPFISYFWTASMPHEKQPPETFANFTMQMCMEMAPLNLMSRIIGDIASSELIPKAGHHRAIKFLAWFYSIDLNEFDSSLESYRTSQEFFSRRFKDISTSRPIAQDALELVSPCDAEILQCGELENGPNNKKVMLQVKGYSYPVEGLFRMSLPMDLDNPLRDQLSLPPLPSSAVVKNEADGSSLTTTNTDAEMARMYFVFHLRPGDYHRVHSPRDTKITKTLYVPGLLYPTTHAAMRWLPNLILSNERILSFGYSFSSSSPQSQELTSSNHENDGASSSTEPKLQQQQQQQQQQQKKKLTAMALVGATCVGKIVTTFDQRIVTNLPEPPETTIVREYKNAAPIIRKGDEVGYFQWGSCVVLVADVERKSLEKNGGKLCVKPGDEVKVGQRLI